MFRKFTHKNISSRVVYFILLNVFSQPLGFHCIREKVVFRIIVNYIFRITLIPQFYQQNKEKFLQHVLIFLKTNYDVKMRMKDFMRKFPWSSVSHPGSGNCVSFPSLLFDPWFLGIGFLGKYWTFRNLQIISLGTYTTSNWCLICQQIFVGFPSESKQSMELFRHFLLTTEIQHSNFWSVCFIIVRNIFFLIQHSICKIQNPAYSCKSDLFSSYIFVPCAGIQYIL